MLTNNHIERHNVTDNDILQEIPDRLLPKLRDLFKTNWPSASLAYFFTDMIIQWKNKQFNTNVQFYAPNGVWQDGTFVAVINQWNYKIYFYSLHGSDKELMKALYSTKKIYWKKGAYIIDCHEKLIKSMMESLIPKLNLPIHHFLFSSNWWLDKKIAIKYSINFPADVYVDILTPKMAKVINSYWPEVHRFPGSESFLSQLIERNESLGIFSKETNDLRCWLTINEFGAIATLQTVDKFRRKGYASLLVKEITNRRATKGLDSIAAILQENTASISLFSKLGFIRVNDLRCVKFDSVE